MSPGELVAGRFRIEAEAGSGAMGVVYRAVDVETGSRVALKILRGDERQHPRFAREARVLARVQHPAIVGYVAHGATEKGAPFLAMQWLEGEDLESRLKRGPLPVSDAVLLARRIADGLAILHARKIVHRDLKPSNMFLPEGDVRRVMLLDFGIARVVDATIAMTQTGVVVGTPSYMAPEQARGHMRVDARADIFALGCVLYECLTGRCLFVGEHVMAILMKILLEDAPPVSERRPSIPSRLDDLVRRMLSKDPAQRPATAAAVRDELDGIEITLAPGDGVATLDGTSRRPPSLSRGEQHLVSVVIAETPLASVPKRTESLVAGPQDMANLWSAEEEGGSSDALAGTLLAAPTDAMVSELVSRFDARVEHLADGILVATLRSTGAATDQAAQAARCALRMRHVFATAPIVLATGRALVSETFPIGPVIDKAVTILHERQGNDPFAQPEIRLDDVTAGLLPSRFRVRTDALGSVLMPEEDMADAPRTLLGKPTPFVGRDQELGTLAGLFGHVENDSVARAVLVTGAPGLGKSRLRAEFIRELRARNPKPAIWIGTGDPLGAHAPLATLARAIRGAFGLMDDVGSAKLEHRRIRQRVARRVPKERTERVAAFIAELLRTPDDETDNVELLAARQDPALKADQMQRAFLEWLAGECAAHSVVLILEDAHWADPGTMRLVDAALRELGEQPLLVVALARPEIEDAFPALWSERGGWKIVLPPLPTRASERLARRVLGKKAADELVHRIIAHANGNPFFLEELLRSAADGGDEQMPETVLAMVQKRLEGLDTESRRVLRAASVFGPVFWRGGVAALLGAKDEPLLDGWLTSLVEREVLVRLADARFASEIEYGFRHGLVRDCAYLMLTDTDRSLAHTLAADWLSQAGERSPAVIAEHLERGGDLPRAIDHYARAVQDALEADDLQSAVQMATHALGLGATAEARGILHLLRGEAHRWRGNLDGAHEDAREALNDLPIESDDWFRAIGGAIAAGVSTGRLNEAVELAGRLRDASAAGRPTYAMALAQSATYLLGGGRLDVADALLTTLDRWSNNTAHTTPTPLLTARIALAHAMQCHVRGDAVRAIDKMLEAAKHFQEANDPRSECAARANAGLISSFIGQLETAETLLTASLAMARKGGAFNTIAWIQQSVAVVIANLGRHKDALALAREAGRAANKQRDRRLEAKSSIIEAEILLDLGDDPAAELAARHALELGQDSAALRAGALAALSTALGRMSQREQAYDSAHEAIALLDAGEALEEGEAMVRLVFAEALWGIGECSAAREAIGKAEALLLDRARALDEADRRAFLDRVPAHARTLARAGEWRSAEDTARGSP